MIKKPDDLKLFFIQVILFSWILWLPGVLAWFGLIHLPGGILAVLKLTGALSPAIFALILTGRNRGKQGLSAMLKSSFNIKRGWPFLLAASVLLLATHALSRFMFQFFTDELPQSDIVTSIPAAVGFFIAVFIMGGGLGEEIGWRGFALVKLQETNSALKSSLILSAVWIIWHLPLFYYGGTNQSLIPFWAFLLTVIPLGVMLTCVFNNTGTIFAAAFFHTIGNLAHELFRVIPNSGNQPLTGFFILTALYYAAAIVITIKFGAGKLRTEKRSSI